MRDHSRHIELSREAAVEAMLQALPSTFGHRRIDRVSVDASYGRVLAEDVRYQTDLPTVRTCLMDSVAVRWEDFADLPEGALPDASSWVRGKDWEFANTGVAMPAGFDTAIVVEHVDVSGDAQSIQVRAVPSRQHAGTREAGSVARAGEVAVRAGCVITPDIAARIASAGVRSVPVVARPRVAFVPTGNELVPPGLPFSSSAPERFAGIGKVYESNSVVVRGKVEAWGGVFVPFDIVPDEREAIERAIRQACEAADIVVLNAGSSKGSDDWSVEVLEETGRIICHQTNHGPGHHSSYALVGDVPIVGISGPSGGASFTLDFYLLPLMKRFFGLDPTPQTIPARLMAPFPVGHMAKRAVVPVERLAGEQRPAEATDPGDEFFSVRFVELAIDDAGCLVATPVEGRPGSSQAEHANAYCMVAAGPAAVPPKAGDLIAVELRSKSLR